MKLIVLSHPDNLLGEKDSLYSLFDMGLQRFHLRKPSWSKEQLTNWLNRWPKELRSKTVIHGHPDIAIKYGLAGVHRVGHQDYEELVTQQPLDQSKSFHTLDEIMENRFPYTYGFLSPIFNSISKAGHNAAFSEEALKKTLSTSTSALYALGGIDHSKVAKAKSYGFQGVAVLGALWQNIIHTKIKDEFQALLDACKS